jgi:hypothetical protein
MHFYWIILFSQLYICMLYADEIIPTEEIVSYELEEISCDNSCNNTERAFTLLSPSYDHDNIIVYKFLDQQKNSYIVFIKDEEDNHYIVKQEKGRLLKNQFRSLCETLCAHIATQLSIPSHYVKLLPIGMNFPGKFISKRTATLHTKVPGNTIRTSTHNLYSKLDIKQATDNNLPFDRQGLNERTIFSMSLHPQLPKIVALDTFIGNKDRNKANILYDSVTDAFYAIDMSLMYDIVGNRKSVAQIACEKITYMIEQHQKFSKQELQALNAYRIVLQDLVKEFPPKKIGDLLDALILESGLIGALSPFAEKDVYALSNVYKRAMKQSYAEVKKLIYLLYVLINN